MEIDEIQTVQQETVTIIIDSLGFEVLRFFKYFLSSTTAIELKYF